MEKFPEPAHGADSKIKGSSKLPGNTPQTLLDMFRPVQIKLGCITLKEAQVIIFACMTACVAHLELVTHKTLNVNILNGLLEICLPMWISQCLLVRPWNKFCRMPKDIYRKSCRTGIFLR